MEPTELKTKPRSERVQHLFNYQAPDYQADLLDYAEDTNKAQAAPKKGRQVGASMVASAIVADYAVTHKNKDVLIASPKQDPADELFEKFKDRFQESDFKLRELGVVEDNKTEWRFSTGTRVLCRTLGQGDLSQRSLSPSCVVIDEAQDASDYHLAEVVEPFFITHDTYEYYLFGTPRGKTGYFYEAVEGANSDSWYSPHWPTEISPFADQDYIDRKRKEKDSTAFAQEYLGQFTDTGEVWIPSDLFRSCVTKTPEYASEELLMGVDVARKGKDETVYLLQDKAGGVRDIWKEATSTVPGVIGRIKNFAEEYSLNQVLVDENAVGGGVVDDRGLQDLVRGITFSTQTKHDMYTQLKTDLENGDIVIPNSIDHYRQLEGQTTRLEFDFTSNGYLKVSHPPGGHDDFADAFALANHGRHNQHKVRYRNGNRSRSGNVRT